MSRLSESPDLRREMAELFKGRRCEEVMNELISAMAFLIRTYVPKQQWTAVVTTISRALMSSVLDRPGSPPESRTVQ